MLNTPASSKIDLKAVNTALGDKSPQEIIKWAASLGKRAFMTTTFGDHSAVILHMVTCIIPNIHILWIDTGYNSSATYRFAEKLMDKLGLVIDIYTPEMTSARRNVLMKGIPDINDPLHKEFTRQVKLEPFRRAFNTIKPEVWVTGLRSEQTDHRKNLDLVSHTKENCLKVAPIKNWTQTDLHNYLKVHNLPNEADYYDPTKGHENRECGLHTKF